MCVEAWTNKRVNKHYARFKGVRRTLGSNATGRALIRETMERGSGTQTDIKAA
jgi:hypothetical protein